MAAIVNSSVCIGLNDAILAQLEFVGLQVEQGATLRVGDDGVELRRFARWRGSARLRRTNRSAGHEASR